MKIGTADLEVTANVSVPGLETGAAATGAARLNITAARNTVVPDGTKHFLRFYVIIDGLTTGSSS